MGAQVGSDGSEEHGEQLVSLQGQLAQVSAALSILGILEQATDAAATVPSSTDAPRGRGPIAKGKGRGKPGGLSTGTHSAKGKGAQSSKARWAGASSASGQSAKGRWGSRTPLKGRGKAAAQNMGTQPAKGSQPAKGRGS